MDSFLSPYGLSNSGKEKLQFTPFWGVPKPDCSNSLRAEFIESHNFFVLGPILVKFHIQTRLIQSFPTIFPRWWCGKEKLHFTPFHTLRHLTRDKARFHHLVGSQSFERGTGRYLYADFSGVGKIWRPCDLRSGRYKSL